MPDSIHEIILEVTNHEETNHFCFGGEVERAGQSTFGSIFGGSHPGWGQEVEGWINSPWDAETGRAIF